MKTVLLTSEDFVKTQTNIDDNLAGKFLMPSIREAQDVALREILGGALLAAIKQKVEDDTIKNQENAFYKDLLDQCQYFLAYKTAVEVLNKASYKIANAGVVKTSEERVVNASEVEIGRQDYYYQSKADSYAYLLQTWLLKNASRFPELGEAECCRLRSNLYSAASCGIWLGGPRGKCVPGVIVRRGSK